MKNLPAHRKRIAAAGWPWSWTYGLAYLALIPIFAGIYTLLADDFYYATAKVEGSAHDLPLSAQANLFGWLSMENEAAIHRDLRLALMSEVELNKESNLQPSFRFQVLLSSTEGRHALTKSFKVVMSPVPTWRESRHGPHPMAVSVVENRGPSIFDSIFGLRREGIGSGEDLGQGTSALSSEGRASGNEEDLAHHLFNCFFYTAVDNSCVLKMPEKLKDALDDYARLEDGRPSRAGTLERMLYFSAVTATTVGYGDIVPLTAKARAAVGLEAVLEIVLVGLFLNALFTGIKR